VVALRDELELPSPSRCDQAKESKTALLFTVQFVRSGGDRCCPSWVKFANDVDFVFL
jgi:hypothetical protein